MLKQTVLVVEDETILREAYSMVLEAQYFNIITAANGLEALNEFKRNRPDLILLDLLMPVMNGEQFLKESEVLTKHKEVKVIVYSNLSDQVTVDRLLQQGIYKHILKSSMSPSQLVNCVVEALKH
ncbi:MAG: hypothetical protein NVSMB46_04810 [Candidatus Saccharimonadales bacterium]